MEVQTVGSQNQVQQNKSKNKLGWQIAGTAIGVAGGAYGGYALGGHLMKDELALATKNTDPNVIKETLRKAAPDLSAEVFEDYWKKNADQLAEKAQHTLKEVTKLVKKIKINAAVMGAAVGGLIVLGGNALINKLNNKKAA